MPSKPFTPTSEPPSRDLLLVPALVAGALAVALALVLRLVLGIITPAELYGESLIGLIPLPVFSQLLSFFGGNAKHLFFAALLAGEALLTGAGGALYLALRARLAPRASSIPVLWEVPLVIIWLWLLAAGIVAPLTGGGFFGAGFSAGVGGTFLALLLPDAVFALVLFWLLRETLLPADAAAPDAAVRLSRRRLLNRGLTAALVIAGAGAVWNLLSAAFSVQGRERPALRVRGYTSKVSPPPTPDYGPWASVAGQTPEVTSAQDFYYVAKNFGGDPQVDASSWRLSIGGLVERPYTLSYDELRALPPVERYHTLECISNEVGGDLMSNALFRGTSLASILTRAGVRENATEVIFRAADGYSDALHLSQALDPRALVVYEINGAALPAAHGFPARLLIPGLYGMKNGKWLTSLEAGSGGYQGYWEARGWTNEALVKPATRIDTPAEGAVLTSGLVWIAGVAYTADRGVGQVQVSTDAGATWQAATLRRPLGDLTWVLWEYRWQAPQGAHIVAARVIDLAGNVQAPAEAPTLPDGASGYHAARVYVG